MPTLTNLKVNIPRNEVLKRLRYHPSKTDPQENIDNLIDNLIEDAYILMEPKALYKDILIEEKSGNIVTLKDCTFVIEGAEIAGLLQKSHKVVLMAVTIGPDLPLRSQRYMQEKKVTEAMVLDAIGSEAVEALADKVNEIIRTNANLEGCVLTKRYSPGYSDWAITAQKELLHVLGAQDIGIQLNPACLMIPEKSISAVIGYKEK
ncbi:MAG: vitamin B12 dependent-methionine synthase activation domain-containing protein [Candidatus Ancaeobacter aquaticus]|nr:vitamin B12 dependent-methionine synthase activation domain-containing protein [Candidatus Ancaeobacter aquaticus]